MIKNNKEKSKPRLIQFKVSPETYDELERMRIESGSLTMSEIIRASLKLYSWAFEKKKIGYTFFSMPEDGNGVKYEVIIP